MYIVLNLDDIRLNNIISTESMRNTVIDNSSFIRLMYSDNNITLNAIYINIPLLNPIYDKYFQKYKCSFSLQTNENLIKKLQELENNILDHMNIYGKVKKLNFSEQLSFGFIKIFLDDLIEPTPDSILVLKISGIWESDTEYGITYKFILVNHL